MASPIQASSHDLASLVQGTVGLPTLPEVIGKLNAVLERDDASAAEVAKVQAGASSDTTDTRS